MEHTNSICQKHLFQQSCSSDYRESTVVLLLPSIPLSLKSFQITQKVNLGSTDSALHVDGPVDELLFGLAGSIVGLTYNLTLHCHLDLNVLLPAMVRMCDVCP